MLTAKFHFILLRLTDVRLSAKKLFKIVSVRFLPPERLHPASMQLIPASVGAIVIR